MNFGLRYIFLVQKHAKKCCRAISLLQYIHRTLSTNVVSFQENSQYRRLGVIDFIHRHQATSRNFEGGKINKCLVKMLMTIVEGTLKNNPNILRERLSFLNK